MKTAIILVTYNGWNLTKACLNDLGCDDNFIIAVADNCSSDNTVENIRKEFPYVHVYPQKENGGFGKANNNAIRALINDGFEFENICLLNNDTRFKNGEIKKLAEELNRLKNCGHFILTPTILNSNGTLQKHYFAKISTLQFLLNAFRSESAAAKHLEGNPKDFCGHNNSNLLPQKFSETFWASAVCWMFSKNFYQETLQKFNEFFDEKIFMYYEDYELAHRAIQLGYRFLISKQVNITHLGGGSAEGNLPRALQHDRSQNYVFKKLYGFKGIIISKTFRTTRSLVRICSAIPLVILRKKSLTYLTHHLKLLKEAL